MRKTKKWIKVGIIGILCAFLYCSQDSSLPVSQKIQAVYVKTQRVFTGKAPQGFTLVETILPKEGPSSSGGSSATVSAEAVLTDNAVSIYQDETFNGFTVPAWDGKTASIEINNGDPFFSWDERIDSVSTFQNFTTLDKYGRCGTAYACITKSMMPTKERESISSVKPSGWHSVQYDFVESKYLYNRCHLIGYQLTGENANRENLITGTRSMNVAGMEQYENAVAGYLKENPGNHVLYRVTPYYNGDDLVAKGVLMEAWSVEDNGAMSFCVWCYNTQPGIAIKENNKTIYEDIVIDYQTGEPKLTRSYNPMPGISYSR